MRSLASIAFLLSIANTASSQDLLYQYFLERGVDMRGLDNHSIGPSDYPSLSPVSSSEEVSDEPSSSPSGVPSDVPSLTPSSDPSAPPSNLPSDTPSLTPSSMPSDAPSLTPSSMPSDAPSLTPSSMPSDAPSLTPSSMPSDAPSLTPSSMPSDAPSLSPSSSPSDTPSLSPSTSPSGMPSLSPSDFPSTAPSGFPSTMPSDYPSINVPEYDEDDKVLNTPTPFPTAVDTEVKVIEFIPDYSGIASDAAIMAAQCGCGDDRMTTDCYDSFKTVFFENDVLSGKVQWFHGTTWSRRADRAIQAECDKQASTAEETATQAPSPSVEAASSGPVLRRWLRH